MSEADQIETQAATIRRLWVVNCRLRKRVEIQQSMIDCLRRPSQPTALEMADEIFKLIAKGAGDGQG